MKLHGVIYFLPNAIVIESMFPTGVEHGSRKALISCTEDGVQHITLFLIPEEGLAEVRSGINVKIQLLAVLCHG